jgi:predicted RNA-binding protein
MKRQFSQSDFQGKRRRINEGFSSPMRMKQEQMIVEVFCTLEQLFKRDKKN